MAWNNNLSVQFVTILRKVPHPQWVGFVDHYYQYGRHNPNSFVGLGAAFLINFFYPQLNETLYYEESDEAAREIIESTYVDQQENN